MPPPTSGLKMPPIITRKASQARRRRPEDVLDLPHLMALVAGAAAPPPAHVFTAQDLAHIAGDEIREDEILTLEDFDSPTDVEDDLRSARRE